ncbi:MAG: hypothetical protein Q7W45_01650 [Bacteroidota bacterium]|nr:hypothetical protein [Bacteroidota bacterium]MDP3144547.1 hypothetical protein [Bacteroidota bacterium]MDP3555790.1 hypothetical protein [Bacteroidota bacterium]
MKAIIILSAMFINMHPINRFADITYANDKIEITKNQLYKGKDLDAMYKITCFISSLNKKRYFEVIKTDYNLKNFFLADYLLIEKINDKTEYYPLGWVTDKIKQNDIKINCQSIVKGEVNPVRFE